MELDDRANPIACSLSQVDGNERRQRWLRLGDLALSDNAPTQAGVRLCFRRLRGVESELRELAPSLSTSGETLTIEESMNLEGENGDCWDVGDEHEWSQGCG